MTTNQRTFSREQWESAQAAWRAADLGPEWREWRHLAAMTAGIIIPPTGTKWDSWGDADPSQAALLIRAIRDTPDLLRAALHAPGVHSWGVVIAILMRGRDALMDQVEQRERDWSAVKAPRRGAMTPIAETLSTLIDSLGGDR
jgi:hypothetical protein